MVAVIVGKLSLRNEKLSLIKEHIQEKTPINVVIVEKLSFGINN